MLFSFEGLPSEIMLNIILLSVIYAEWRVAMQNNAFSILKRH